MSAETVNNQKGEAMNVIDEIYYEAHEEDLASAYADYVNECKERGEKPLPFHEWVNEL